MIEYIKLTFEKNLILSIFIIYVITYIVYNWNILKNDFFDLNNYKKTDYENPIIYTGIIAILILILIGDKENTADVSNVSNIKKSITPIKEKSISPKLSPLTSSKNATQKNIQQNIPKLTNSPKIDNTPKLTGGINNFKVPSKNIFIPYNKKDMYMDVVL